MCGRRGSARGVRICARHAARGGCKSRAAPKLRAAPEVARGGVQSCARRRKLRAAPKVARGARSRARWSKSRAVTGVARGCAVSVGDRSRCGSARRGVADAGRAHLRAFCGSARGVRICARHAARGGCKSRAATEVARGYARGGDLRCAGPSWGRAAAPLPRLERLGRLGCGSLAIEESVRVPERDRLVGTLVSPAPVSEGRVVVGAGQSDRSERDSRVVARAVVSRSRSGKLGDRSEGDSTGVGAAVVSRLERSCGRYADG